MTMPTDPDEALRGLIESDAEAREAKARAEFVKAETRELIIASLRQLGLPVLTLGSEEEKEMSRFERRLYFTEIATTEINEQIEFSEDGDEEMTFDSAWRLAATYLSAEMNTEQRHVLTLTLIRLNAVLATYTSDSRDERTLIKKQAIARHLSDGHLKLDDPWFQVYNAVLDGDPFDPNSYDDQLFVIAAENENEQDQTAVNRFCNELLFKISEYTRGTHMGERKQIVYKIVTRVVAYASLPSPEAAAELDEVVRSYGIDPGVLKEDFDRMIEELSSRNT